MYMYYIYICITYILYRTTVNKLFFLKEILILTSSTLKQQKRPQFCKFNV